MFWCSVVEECKERLVAAGFSEVKKLLLCFGVQLWRNARSVSWRQASVRLRSCCCVLVFSCEAFRGGRLQ